MGGVNLMSDKLEEALIKWARTTALPYPMR